MMTSGLCLVMQIPPDLHFYDYSADCEDYNTFPASRFVSEFGYQSLPSFVTMAKVSEPQDWNR
jgi:beta-mannosidase